MSDKSKPDWERIEHDYRAGIKTLREIGNDHGVSHTSVRKRAEREKWGRDLEAKVRARAAALVSKAEVSKVVSSGKRASELETVEVEAQVQARIRLAHRTHIGRARELVQQMLAELEHQTAHQGTFEQLLELLAEQNEGESTEAAADRRKRLWEQWNRAMTLGPRVDTAKKLAEALRILIDKEREAYSIDQTPVGPGDFESRVFDMLDKL